MKEHLIDLSEAENDLTTAAAYLAENIGSSDGHAEAMREIADYYIQHGKVDLAAELADTIKDNFVRDNLLVKIAEKCAADGDDEYAFQLTEAIEDRGLQSAAAEGIAVRQALRGDFAQALKSAKELPHPDYALAAIAARQIAEENENDFRRTFAQIEHPTAKIQALQSAANHFYEQKGNEKAAALLDEAESFLDEIELPEEKIRAMLNLAAQHIEAARFDKSIEILGRARTEGEVLDSIHRESLLSRTSLDFLRSDSLDLADHTLDLIKDKTQIAATLAGFSAEFERESNRADALETLEEAYAILKSQRQNEIQDSRSRFSLLGSIAVSFAQLEQFEKALKIALENPSEEERGTALLQIAVVRATKENAALGRQILEVIEDDEMQTFALINISDAENKKGNESAASNLLNEACDKAKNISRPTALTNALNEIVKRFCEAGEREKGRAIATESFKAAGKILDESHRAVAVLRLGELYEDCEFKLDGNERAALNTMLRKAEW